MSEDKPNEEIVIQIINKQRWMAIQLLLIAQKIMKDTQCSLGADIIRECIGDLNDKGCDEY